MARPPATVRLLTEPEWAWRRQGPTPRVLQVFGVRPDRLRHLARHVWTDGRLVLKPVGCVPEHDWVCEVYAGWDCPDVRVPEPVHPGAGGSWSVDGWGAHVFLPGRETDLLDEVSVVKQASAAFHAAVADLPRPAFTDHRDDPWAYGDRLAWQTIEPLADTETLATIERLRAHLEPVGSPDQPVHGDVLPNVLVADGLPPAIIDWPPYFRPLGTAEAIAVVDAVTFRDAPLSMLDDWAVGEDWDQLLVRALLYRLGPTGLFALHGTLMGSLTTHLQRARPVVDAVLAR